MSQLIKSDHRFWVLGIPHEKGKKFFFDFWKLKCPFSKFCMLKHFYFKYNFFRIDFIIAKSLLIFLTSTLISFISDFNSFHSIQTSSSWSKSFSDNFSYDLAKLIWFSKITSMESSKCSITEWNLWRSHSSKNKRFMFDEMTQWYS